MTELTKAEEQVMQVLWEIKKGFVKDILVKFPKPKPAYNTVSTIVRILEKKGFIDHVAYGKTHEYYPLISKDSYKSFFLKSMMTGYFNGSFTNLISFFARENNLNIKEVEELLSYVSQEENNPPPQNKKDGK